MNEQKPLKILFIGDVVGSPGRKIVSQTLPRLIPRWGLDLVVCNAENAAGGSGLTLRCYEELSEAGVDVMTMGDHVYRKDEIFQIFDRTGEVLRPANYPPGAPGVGHCLVSAGGEEVLVMNLMGRLFMHDLDDPFRAADAILAQHPDTRFVLCDMHAEATSEKVSMGWYLDGRVSAVVGTHTHVPTADQRVLPGGTAYCTDVGMVGPRDGVIGMDKDGVLRRFLTGVPQTWRMASGTVTFNSVLITIDRLSGRATSIQRIDQEQT